MSGPEDTPRFPNIIPDSIKKSRIWVLENDDFESGNDVSELLAQLFDYPEDHFYLFIENGTPINTFMNASIEQGIIRIVETQSFFYRHPKFKRDYVRIREHSIKWDWEREVVKKGPMYFRDELVLSEKTRRTFEMQQLVEMQKSQGSNPLKLEPNFMGIGVDLRKVYAWLKGRFQR